MIKQLLGAVALAAGLAAPVTLVSPTAAEAAVVSVRDGRNDRDWRNDRRPGRDWRSERYRNGWQRYDRRPYSWQRGNHRPAWHWCYDRWGRAYVCR